MSGIDWGDAPTWLGACFAAAAAAAAVWTLASQRRQITEQREFIGEQSATLALERAALSAAAEDRKWAQARQVVMHHEQHGLGFTIFDEGVPGTGPYWIVTVRNSSDAPIRQLKMMFGTAYIATEVYEEAVTATQSDERRTHPLALLGPNRQARFCSPRWSEERVQNNRPQLTFTDDDGHRWNLDSFGSLSEAPAAPPA
ncbi:hypothetical protein [Streptomyces stelliscabiei]|uniref:hypothetical protein n=1 Tax=Streptomyces stelliscabiei TaxID=146820 RepID=UPI0029BE713D|nr:hypothetical protein [Streptomyces stelliscabiei]MDX2616132.1 hypothetical protein [Streptomyces stelliscabiei]MDX2634180.1 hypothetical protein [Streptomyces stelliscabiei]MDX2664609.1 hypothetical protein [Streptomyces stelliscabiei]MDX2713828.1 hypothetical protein [Streptomyces stelliscabiei]MDX2785776.1 hypothetical protein [Streptomyces stelliscabiei]